MISCSSSDEKCFTQTTFPGFYNTCHYCYIYTTRYKQLYSDFFAHMWQMWTRKQKNTHRIRYSKICFELHFYLEINICIAILNIIKCNTQKISLSSASLTCPIPHSLTGLVTAWLPQRGTDLHVMSYQHLPLFTCGSKGHSMLNPTYLLRRWKEVKPAFHLPIHTHTHYPLPSMWQHTFRSSFWCGHLEKI